MREGHTLSSSPALAEGLLERGTFVGVDVGGTKIAAAALTDRVLGEALMVPTDLTSGEAIVEQIVAQVNAVGGEGVAAVGIGVPSVVEFATGRVRNSANIPLKDLPLRELLGQRLGVPVFVENDASCAALAEAFDDEGTLVTPDLVLFTVGTGVGGGLVIGGRVFRGATGAAPEIGHTIIGLDLTHGAPAALPHPPQHGSLEELAAGRALDRLAMQAAREEPGSALGVRLAEQGSVEGVDVVECAREGDPAAARVMRILGERLGVGIANAINTFDPREVVIGGGVSTAGDLLLVPATEVARRFTLPGVGTETTIRLARHGVHAGVLGAALLAAQEVQET